MERLSDGVLNVVVRSKQYGPAFGGLRSCWESLEFGARVLRLRSSDTNAIRPVMLRSWHLGIGESKATSDGWIRALIGLRWNDYTGVKRTKNEHSQLIH